MYGHVKESQNILLKYFSTLETAHENRLFNVFGHLVRASYLNKESKTYHLVFDCAWMEFSDQKVLVVRKKQKYTQI